MFNSSLRRLLTRSFIFAAVLAVALWSAGPGLFIQPANATVTVGTVASQITQAITIKAASSARSAIKVPITGANGTPNETLAAVTVVATDNGSSGFNPATDLAALATSASSGIMLFTDSSGAPGSLVPLSSISAWSGGATTMTLTTPATLPATFWVLFQTASGATAPHSFVLTLPANGIATSANSPTITPVSTAPITIDTTAPAISSGNTGPSNGATNVPISTFIHLGFSKNLDQTTLNGFNVSICSGSACGSGGAAVGAAIRPYPNGLDLIVSNPPTYAASSNFAKLTTAGTGFYFIQGTSAITPQPPSGYASPTAGDIVVFQHDTFPAQLGIITNGALTSGTFAINGFNIMGGQQITKVAAPAATGAVSGTTAVNLGDIIVVNTTANPTGNKYDWHLVTSTGATAINGGALRLDGASAQPTFVSGSSFSTITPIQTAAVDGTGKLTMNFGVGDLVFANVTANADNLNAYAWHTVTTAENISVAVPSALRLDSATNAPTFAASSQASRLASSANGAVTDSSTQFSFGDIVFAKTTANAGVNGSYAFHQVSNGATGAASANLRFDNASSTLTPSTSYFITAGVGVKDLAGNPLASPVNVSFTTGSTGATNTTPPFVQSSTPTSGNQTFPIAAPINLVFSQPMSTTGGASGANSVTNPANVGLFLNSNGQPGAAVAATNTYNSSNNTLTITPASALSASTGYVATVSASAQSSTGAPAQNFFLNFMTASGADTTRPTVAGVSPSVNASNVILPVNDIMIGFSKDINAGTINSSNITISPAAAGTVTYNPGQRAAHFSPTAALAAGTTYTIIVGAAVADLSGNGLAGNGGSANAATVAGSSSSYVYTFATSNTADTSQPTVQFANADNFGVAITFSKAMKTGGGPSAADNIANYTLESPAGTTVALGGKTVVWDGQTMTARISGLTLQNTVGFKVTASNLLQDLAGNAILTTGSPAGNIAQGTVANSSTTGGQLGPGSGPMQSASMQGMSPVAVFPMNRVAGGASSYSVQMPVGTAIPNGGSIVLTFPTGFDVTSAAAMSSAESPAMGDINGPGQGTVTVSSVTNNASARTITLTIAVSGAADTGTSFLHIDLKSIVNSTVPNSSGYTVDIKTKDASGTILQTMTSSNFYLGQAGTNTLTANVYNAVGNAPISGAVVFLFSPGTGGQSATTNGSGVATFNNLSNGSYMIGLDPSTVGNFSFNSAPQPISISGNTTQNFGLTASPRAISGTIYGPASTKVDVFASSPNGFAKTTVTTNSTPVTVNSVTYGGSVAYSLPAQNNTTYQVNIGPSVPATFSMPGAPPPPPPVFTFMPPAPTQVNVVTSDITGQNFTLVSVGSNKITGTVVDSAGTGINAAQVFARPSISSTTGGAAGFGAGAQTDSSGSFTINVPAGVYIVGVFKPGMPMAADQQATASASPTPLTFKLGASSSALTITGTVTDDSGNVIPYAGISGRKVNSISDTTAIGGTAGNFVGGPTDSNGAYTLYVTAGTWVVEAFAPGFGRLGSKTVTVTTSSLTGQNFSAATLSVGTITGQATKATVAQQGVMVRAEGTGGTTGGNMVVTDSSGNYSLKVPAGTYTVTCFFPGVGDGTPIMGVTVAANATTSGQNCTIASPITITVNLTDGANPISGAFVDVRDSNGRGNGTNTSTVSGANAVYTVQVPPGTYTVRAGHPSYGMIGSTSAVSTTQAITYTAAVGATYAVTGTVTGNGTALGNAWVSIVGTPTGQTNAINLGAQTASDGTFSISVPNGTYRVRADKPGYKSPASAFVTVSSATISAGTIALTTASLTITGTVTLNGSAVSNAFVDASDGSGGFAVAQTGTDGTYSLAIANGTWTVRAHSIGYQGGPVTVTVSGSNSTGNTITLSAMSGFTVKPEKQETVTPTSGGFFTNSDIGSGFKLNIPANALGTSSNAATIKTQVNTALPNPPTGTILNKNAVTISATDSSGAPIKNLSNSVTVVVPYDPTALPGGVSATSLVLGVWNSSTQNYDTLPTTVDTTANTLTATVSHFSDFAPLTPAGGAPSAPTGLSTASQSSSRIDLSWSASSGATSYDIYRDTSSGGAFPRVGSEPTVSSGSTTTYSDTGLTASTAYYYKITAINSAGSSSASSAVTATTKDGGGGGGGGGGSTTTATSITTTTTTSTTPAVAPAATTPAPTTTQTAQPATTPAPTMTRDQLIASLQTQIADLIKQIPALVAQEGKKVTPGAITSTFVHLLGAGSKGNEVRSLQNFLRAQGHMTASATGTFGPLTKVALEKFQGKWGIAKKGDAGYGVFGPKTRAKVNELMGQ